MGRRRACPGWGWAVLVVLLAAGCATRVTEYHAPPPLTAGERTALNGRIFDRAWELVNEKYFDAGFHGVDWRAAGARYRPRAVAAPDDTALYRVLNRMCAELKESHLTALSPRRAHELATDHRAAIGIRWLPAGGQRVVTEVVPGGPADRAGVKPGWLLVSRDGVPLREGQTFVTHVGRPVTFGFIDAANQPRTLTLTPELLSFDRRELRELPGGFVYLRFDRFDRGALHWLGGELQEHAAAPGVVVDLRGNGGGSTLWLNVAIAEFFPGRVDEGRVIRRSGSGHEARSFAWGSAHYRGRVVLLTGKATASAAEIFSHVLQHYRRATVVGQRTAGAVIYARNYSLPGGGSLQVPVMDYIGLDGKRLEGRGVTPDVVVPEPTLADWRAARDADLAAALGVLGRGVAPGAAATVR